MSRDVDVPLGAIVEPQVKPVGFEHFDVRHVHHHGHSRGSMCLSGCLRLAKIQSSSNSLSCNAAHSITRPMTRGGSLPSNSLTGSSANLASCPPYRT